MAGLRRCHSTKMFAVDRSVHKPGGQSNDKFQWTVFRRCSCRPAESRAFDWPRGKNRDARRPRWPLAQKREIVLAISVGAGWHCLGDPTRETVPLFLRGLRSSGTVSSSMATRGRGRANAEETWILLGADSVRSRNVVGSRVVTRTLKPAPGSFGDSGSGRDQGCGAGDVGPLAACAEPADGIVQSNSRTAVFASEVDEPVANKNATAPTSSPPPSKPAPQPNPHQD